MDKKIYNTIMEALDVLIEKVSDDPTISDSEFDKEITLINKAKSYVIRIVRMKEGLEVDIDTDIT